MERHNFYSKLNTPLVLALGFFDCVHIGHKSLIESTCRDAKGMNAECAVFTFSNDPNLLFKADPQIYTIKERAEVLKNLNVMHLICAEFDNTFSLLSKSEFLDALTENYNLKEIVVGKDYRFGKNADGNVDFLKNYMAAKNIAVKVVPFLKSFNLKISTSTLKKFVKLGNVTLLNVVLSQPYFIMGTVEHGNNRGSVMGYPTANISVPNDRLLLGEGVYITRVCIDGKTYNGMTNVGKKPTFDDGSYTVETNIFDVSKDLYGKTIQVQFLKRLRGVIKFKSLPLIKKQLAEDEIAARAYFEKNNF